MAGAPEKSTVGTVGERGAELRSLFTFPTERYRPSIALLLCLVVTAALFACSMPMAWHHHVIPAAGYTVIYGIQGANWLLVVAAVSLGLAVRLVARSPGFYLLSLMSLLAFAAVLGLFGDYIDSQDRAAQIYASAYFGPGFYVALAGVFTLVLALALAWRNRL